MWMFMLDINLLNLKNNKEEDGAYLFDWKYIRLLLIEGHKCNGEDFFNKERIKEYSPK